MPEAQLLWKGYAIKDTDKPFDFELIDFKPKKMGPYDVDIAIEACGVCSSDTHTITGGWGPLNVKPLIPGHEAAGYVRAVGDKVTQFKVGDRAGVGAQVYSCGECTQCKSDNENYCPKASVATYNASYPDGSGDAHGGYAGAIRCHEHWVLKLPDAIEFKHAGPMLCAGITVYSPLVRYGCGPGKKVGIVGIGGLGHHAVMFANALGAEVYAFTHQEDKVQDAKKMGAHHPVQTDKDGKFAEPLAGTLDLIISTVDFAHALPLAVLLPMLKVNRPLISVGLPDDSVEVKMQAFAGNGALLGVTHIGSIKESNEMLALAAKHGLRPWVEEHPMKDAGKANKKIVDNSVRYRGVLCRDLD